MIIGIDIGTTNVKCVIFDVKTDHILYQSAISHNSYIAGTGNDKKKEQDLLLILNSLRVVMEKVPLELRCNISQIAVSGQMHGVCLWNPMCLQYDSESCYFRVLKEHVSNLITWEDGRCDSSFLNSLPKPSRGVLSSGYGCASLCWLSRYDRTLITKYSYAGTIMDFVVWMLTGNSCSATSPQLANSWGYFDVQKSDWESNLLLNDFPDVVSFLPKIEPVGTVIGKVKVPWLGIVSGADVYVALGDFQCSLVVAERAECSPCNVVFNFGTGCQLACPSVQCSEICAVDIWPYFVDSYVAVAASLNGGNVISFAISAVRELLSSIGASAPTEEDMWELMNNIEFTNDSTYVVIPTLLGERHSPDALLNLSCVAPTSNFTFSRLMSSICLGIIRNVMSFYPEDFFLKFQDAKLTCVGKIFKLPVMRSAVQHAFPLRNVEYIEEMNSAFGAVLSVLKTTQ